MCTPGAYLDLHGHLPPVLHPGQVHLPDGGGCEGPLLEVLQLVPPVGAQVTVESFLEGEAGEGPSAQPSQEALQLLCTERRAWTRPCPAPACLTVICFRGMKSALCLTRSKILARWGLMKASSGRHQRSQMAEG